MPTPNPEKLKLVKQQSARGIVFSVARQPGTSTLYLGDSEFKVTQADPTAPKWEQKEIGRHSSYVTGVVLAGKEVISAGYDGMLSWWDAEKGQPVRSVEASKKWVRALALSPDGSVVASVADDMVAKLWDARSGKLIRELRGHQEKTPTHFPSMLFTCAFSPDGKTLATVDKVGHVVLWEVSSGKQATTLEAPELYTWDPRARIHSIGGPRSLAFSPDGKSLAIGGIGKIGNVDHLEGPATVLVFDWQAGKKTHDFAKTKFKGLVERLLFHPQGGWLMALGGANDGFCFFMDLPGKKVTKEEKVAFHVHSAVLNETGDTVYAVGHGKVVVFEMKG